MRRLLARFRLRSVSGPIAARGTPTIALVAILVGVTTGGCAAKEVDTAWELSATEYDATFEAAVSALRDAGFVTAVRDRSGGVIETEPLRIGGVLEPWAAAGQDWSTTGESSLSLQRRRARVTFEPTTTIDPIDSSDRTLDGPDWISATSPDLRHASTPLTIRVWVSVERAHTPGIRRFPWTRSMTTRTVNPVEPIDPADGVLASSIWTPVGRDQDAEWRLASAIRAQRSGESNAMRDHSMRGSTDR